jgi:hypothetical protein
MGKEVKGEGKGGGGIRDEKVILGEYDENKLYSHMEVS